MNLRHVIKAEKVVLRTVSLEGNPKVSSSVVAGGKFISRSGLSTDN